ncbi:MAG: hypothetical protein ACOCRX_02675 [Candidatus Woesearchaeota archaeon]
MKIEKDFRKKIKSLEKERVENEKEELENVIYQEIAEYAYNRFEEFQELADMEYQSKGILNELTEIIKEINNDDPLETYEKERLDSELESISHSYNDLIIENITYPEISKRSVINTNYFDRLGFKKIKGKTYLLKYYPNKMDYVTDAINMKRECKNVYDFANETLESYISNIKNMCVKDITID